MSEDETNQSEQNEQDKHLDEDLLEIEEKLDKIEGSGDQSSGRDPRGGRTENRTPESDFEFESEPERDPGDDLDTGGDSDKKTFWEWFWPAISGFFLAPISKFPRRTKVYQGMIKAGYQGIYKNTSANVVVNAIYGDRYVIPWPAEIDDHEGKVRTSNGEEWTLPDGLQTYRIGDAALMWGVADAHELVSPVGARTAEMIDLENYVYVQNQAQRQQMRKQQQHHPAAASGQSQQAIADGGLTGLTAKSPQFWNGEPFDDVLVNWSNSNPDADGMIVSMEKHYELQHSQAGSEEMKKQEDRGRLAERLKDGKKEGLIYVGLLLLGIAVGLFGPSLAASLGGNGGGSSVSLMAWPLIETISGWV